MHDLNSPGGRIGLEHHLKVSKKLPSFLVSSVQANVRDYTRYSGKALFSKNFSLILAMSMLEDI